jgi:type II secretory pathway component GspD/PulD (secretin)
VIRKYFLSRRPIFPALALTLLPGLSAPAQAIDPAPATPAPATPAPATPAPATPAPAAPAPAAPSGPTVAGPAPTTGPAEPATPTPAPTPLVPPTVPVAPADVPPVPANPAPPPAPAAPPLGQAPGPSVLGTPPNQADQTQAAPGAVVAPRPTTLPARGAYQITGNDAALSVFAVSADAQELFTALAEKAGLRLVVDDTVSRRITVNILQKPARQILDDIVSAYGLSAADVGGVTMISEGIPRSPSSYLLSDITAIPTKYVDAANARNLLPVFLQDYVKVNSEQNAVVLSAPTQVLEKFRQDIGQFDIPASQIVVDLLLVELTNTTVDQLGLSLTYHNGREGPAIDPAAGTITYEAGGTVNSAGVITQLPNQFFARLSALQQKGQARVRANPRIATVSGRQASIFVGQQRYVATPIDTGGNGGSRNYIDAGVNLAITPYTGGQGQILVDVNAEVSTLSAPDPATHLPEKSTRTAKTVVRVKDGQTIVIGGLVQQETRDVRTKVPVLGDIPILGPLLFQTKNVQTTQTELVLFITPRILSNTGHLPGAEERALKARFLDSDLNRPLPPAPRPPDPPIPPSLRLPGLSPEIAIPPPAGAAPAPVKSKK